MEPSERGSILNGLYEQRRKTAELKATREEALAKIPELQLTLAGLITNSVAQETEVISWQVSFNRGFRDFDENRDRLDTKLKAIIHEPEEEDVTVQISTDMYRDNEDPRTPEESTFKIDVNGHPTFLIISSRDITVESKKRRGRAFDSNTPIGVPLPSWPEFTGPATMQDVENYQQLIKVIQNGDVEITGSAPTRYSVDQSTVPQTVQDIRRGFQKEARRNNSRRNR